MDYTPKKRKIDTVEWVRKERMDLEKLRQVALIMSEHWIFGENVKLDGDLRNMKAYILELEQQADLRALDCQRVQDAYQELVDEFNVVESQNVELRQSLIFMNNYVRHLRIQMRNAFELHGVTSLATLLDTDSDTDSDSMVDLTTLFNTDV